jgi:hypothetical protein
MTARLPTAASVVALLALAACGPSAPKTPSAAQPAPPAAASPLTPAVPAAPVEAQPAAPSAVKDDPNAPYTPPAPGQPGGLPDDRTPISEAPFTPQSAQGAANVVQTYYALIEEKSYGRAWALRSGSAQASDLSRDVFAHGFAAYGQYHANIGAPGEMEGAAGSSFVDVPVQVYGRKADGAPFNQLGTVTLRRVNDVDGSTAEQRRWHIEKIELKDAP